MMDLKTLTLLVAGLMGHPHARPNTRVFERASQVAFMIQWAVKVEAEEHRKRRLEPIPPDIVAGVIAAESSFRPAVVGAAGELGFAQIKPDGLALFVCKDLLDHLNEPRKNVLCGVRILRAAREHCGPDWHVSLPRFNGTHACVSTPYSRRVFALLGDARRGRIAMTTRRIQRRHRSKLANETPTMTDLTPGRVATN